MICFCLKAINMMKLASILAPALIHRKVRKVKLFRLYLKIFPVDTFSVDIACNVTKTPSFAQNHVYSELLLIYTVIFLFGSMVKTIMSC